MSTTKKPQPAPKTAPPAAADQDDPNLTAPPLEEEAGADEAEEPLPEDVQAAIDAAKKMVEKRNAGKPDAPASEAYYVQACGEHMVCVLPTLAEFQHVLKVSIDPQKKLQAAMVMVQNTLYWMRGQELPGPGYNRVKAVERFRAQMALGGPKVLLDQQVANHLFDLLNTAAGESLVKKR